MKISIEKQWDSYVEQMLKGVPQNSVQFIETKRTFYSATGNTLVLLREVLGSNQMTEEEGVEILQDMLDQVTNFLMGEVNQKGH